jgi:hypothetical protein
MTTQAKRPPNDRGQGKKSLQGAGKSPVLQVAMTPELKAAAMGYGMSWVREVIGKAVAKRQKAENESA